MSRIRANTITNQNANGAPNFPNGITVTGVVTTTTITQNITGDLTVSGNVGIGGTLTYEDVTNIDSVGVITARSGIRIGATGSNTLITGNGTGIGIGITTPQEELHIRAATPVIRLEDGDNARQSQIVGSDGNLRFDADNNNAIANTNISFRTDGSERLRISSEGYVTKPNNPAFRARSSSGGWKSFGNTNFNTMPFNAEDFDSGSNYNTSTYKFTVPVAGRYYFYAQMTHDGTTANGGNSGKIRIYVGSDIVAYGKSGTQGEAVNCSTVWDCTVGEEVYCQGATNTTNPDDWHGDSHLSYFTGYLIG